MDIEEYSNYTHFYSEEIPKTVKSILKKMKFTSLLDAGCGDGCLLYAMKKSGFLKDKKVYAIDLSKKRVELSKKIDRGFTINIDNAENLSSIVDESIDFLVSTQVIEHVDDEKMVKSIRRVLRKKGIAYISTVFKKWYGWYFYRNNGKWVLDPTHIREYSSDEQLLQFIESSGFKVIKNDKKQLFFPLLDFFIRRFGIKNRFFFEGKFFKYLRKLKIPIIGYKKWELVIKKNS